MKFLGSSDKLEKSNIVLVGLPFDATSSFKSGSRFAPDSIRVYSDVLETYSPYFDTIFPFLKGVNSVFLTLSIVAPTALFPTSVCII